MLGPAKVRILGGMLYLISCPHCRHIGPISETLIERPLTCSACHRVGPATYAQALAPSNLSENIALREADQTNNRLGG